MKIEYSEFVDFHKTKPKDFTTCLVLWKSREKDEIMFGIYYSDKKAFFDGIGAWLDEKYVLKWIDVNNYKLIT